MRFILLLIISAFFLNSCGKKTDNSQASTSDSSVAVSQPDTLCFRQIVGRDSTVLQLMINDSTVSGELAVLPFEKDRARGPIEGKLINQQIRSIWKRLGEGMTQDYEIVFTLKGDAITWREGERVEKQGKWVLKNPEQGYEYKLLKTACP